MKKFPAIAALTALLFALPALANGPCAADREKFCKDVQPGGGAIVKCMKSHEAELSAECKAHHEQMKDHWKEAKEACHDDVEQFCADVKKGRGGVRKCLKANVEKLSADCKTLVEKKKQ